MTASLIDSSIRVAGKNCKVIRNGVFVRHRQQDNTQPENPAEKKEKSPLLLSLTMRALLFTVCMSLALTLLYIAGCFQLFLDSTVFDILRLLSVCAVVQIVFSAFAAAELLIYAGIFRRLGLLARIPVIAASFVLGAVLWGGSRLIIFLSAGIAVL